MLEKYDTEVWMHPSLTILVEAELLEVAVEDLISRNMLRTLFLCFHIGGEALLNHVGIV